jgi:hypothetical protein
MKKRNEEEDPDERRKGVLRELMQKGHIIKKGALIN